MLRRIKIRISNYLLKHLFNAITEDEFMQVQYLNKERNRGIIVVGTEILPDGQALNLASEARTIRKLAVYQKVMKDLKWRTNDKLYNKSKNVDDMVYGKATLYAISILDAKLEEIGRIEKGREEPVKAKTLDRTMTS